MAYFRENETEETKRQPLPVSGKEAADETTEYIESDYDDGFDDPAEEEEEEITPEEKKAIRTKRFRMASGAGNVTAVITGTLVILLLLAFLLNMIGFVLNDADRNFTLFQTRF
jgi:hypothetical protein